MTRAKVTSATNAGTKDSLQPGSEPVVVNGWGEQETHLQHILQRVPPIITLPRPREKCPWTSQSRTSLLELVAPCARNDFKPPVKAIYRRSHKYAARGRWLIPAENLFRYLLSLAEDSAETYSKLAADRKAQRGVE